MAGSNPDETVAGGKRIFLDREAVRLAESRLPDAYYFGSYRVFDPGKDKDSLLRFPFVNEVELVFPTATPAHRRAETGTNSDES